jgi:hypothetical protein
MSANAMWWLGLVAAICASVVDAPGRALQPQKSGDEIEIRRAIEGDGVIDGTRLGRPFKPEVQCTSRRKGSTALDVLRPGLTAVVIHRYDRQAWPEIAQAEDYLRRILRAVPEGDGPQEHIYWSEGSLVQIEGTLIFANGPERRMAVGNGYIHFEDQSGCQWWGRFLGPDRKKWVVRE